MAYADLLRLTTADFDDAATLIDGQLITTGQVNQSSAQTTVSAVMATITGLSIAVNVEATHKVRIAAGYLFSHSSIGGTAGFQLVRGVTNIGSDQACRAYRSNTGGADQLIAEEYIDTPGAGSFTYAVQWNTGGATLYSIRQWMTVMVFRAN